MADRDPDTGLFVKGKIGGPGRPKGSRNKLGEAFITDLYADWEENGTQVIEDVRKERPDVYLKVVASILPKDLNVNINPLEEASDEELIQRLRDLSQVVQHLVGPEGSGGDSAGTRTETAH